MGDDGSIYDTFKWNAGLVMMNPRPSATLYGMDVVVSDHVPADQVIVMGGKQVMGRAAYDALIKAASKVTTTTAEASAAMANLSERMSKAVDKQMHEILAGTAIDPNPEQTEMERNPLWGAF